MVVHLDPLVVVGGVDDNAFACFYNKNPRDFHIMGTASTLYQERTTKFFLSMEPEIGDYVISTKLQEIHNNTPENDFVETGLNGAMVVSGLNPFIVTTEYGNFTFNECEKMEFKVVKKQNIIAALKRFNTKCFKGIKKTQVSTPFPTKLEDLKVNGIGIGDVVVSKNGEHLRSGGTYYRGGVVISVVPFVVVSVEGYVRWGSLDPNNFIFNHKASKERLELCMKRIND